MKGFKPLQVWDQEDDENEKIWFNGNSISWKNITSSCRNMSNFTDHCFTTSYSQFIVFHKTSSQLNFLNTHFIYFNLLVLNWTCQNKPYIMKVNRLIQNTFSIINVVLSTYWLFWHVDTLDFHNILNFDDDDDDDGSGL